MDNKTNKSNRTTRPSSSPMSAEEKLKRSMKGLSHIGGGSGLNINSSSTSTQSANSSSRKKVGGVVLDVGTIQDAHKQKFETKGRRNNVIILVLSLLLVVSLVYLVIAIMGYNNSKRDPNFKYLVEGNATASWIIEGKDETAFLLKDGLKADHIYLVNSQLKVDTVETVSITIEVKVLLEGTEILISGLQGADENFVRVDKTNKFVYKDNFTGGGIIKVFEGIDFSNAPTRLSSSRVVINVTAYVNKV